MRYGHHDPEDDQGNDLLEWIVTALLIAAIVVVIACMCSSGKGAEPVTGVLPNAATPLSLPAATTSVVSNTNAQRSALVSAIEGRCGLAAGSWTNDSIAELQAILQPCLPPARTNVTVIVQTTGFYTVISGGRLYTNGAGFVYVSNGVALEVVSNSLLTAGSLAGPWSAIGYFSAAPGWVTNVLPLSNGTHLFRRGIVEAPL
jgi:hypothetical protein